MVSFVVTKIQGKMCVSVCLCVEEKKGEGDGQTDTKSTAWSFASDFLVIRKLHSRNRERERERVVFSSMHYMKHPIGFFLLSAYF